jgi:hypothetical protein
MPITDRLKSRVDAKYLEICDSLIQISAACILPYVTIVGPNIQR